MRLHDRSLPVFTLNKSEGDAKRTFTGRYDINPDYAANNTKNHFE